MEKTEANYKKLAFFPHRNAWFTQFPPCVCVCVFNVMIFLVDNQYWQIFAVYLEHFFQTLYGFSCCNLMRVNQASHAAPHR